MKRIGLFVTILLCLATPSVMAQDASVAFPFMLVDQNPQTAAMGSVSLNDNAASYVMDGSKGAAGLSWQSWAPSESSFISGGGYGVISGKYGLRARISKQSETPYDIIGDDGIISSQFTPSSLRCDAGFAMRFGENWAAGADVIYAKRALFTDESYSALAFDASLMFSSGRFSAAGAIKAIGGSVESISGQDFKLPSSISLSGAWKAVDVDKHSLDLQAELEYYLYGAAGAGAGICYGFNKLVFVRAGYRTGGIIPSHVSVGAGLDIKGFRLDFAYLAGENIGGSFIIGTAFRF